MESAMQLINGEFYQVEDVDVIAWQQTYKDCDVHAELMSMASWLDANPTRRKTRRGIKRFIDSWLKRANQVGGSSGKLQKPQSGEYTSKELPLDWKRVDVSWVNCPEAKERCKQFYLDAYGFYYDGGRDLEYAR
jgi:hypothetical protein